MTGTVKKRKRMGLDDEASVRAEADYGCRYSCDNCQKDISGLVRIHCAECKDDVDLCVNCFCQRVEIHGHKADHKYRVMDMLDYPIFDPVWSAEEELLLIEGLELYGMGNWEQVAELVATKDKHECRDHYNQLFVDSEAFPLPKNLELQFDHEQGRKNRVAIMEEAAKNRPPPTKAGPPLQSQPLRHDISGFMPARGEFDVEFENDAEQPIKDMVFEEAGGESREEKELKLTMLDIYNVTLDRRAERKKFIFQRKLTDIKRMQAADRKLDKESRELYTKYRVFAKMMPQSDFDAFMDNIIRVHRVKKRISELQELIRIGVKNSQQEQVYRDARRAREQHFKAAMSAYETGQFARANNFRAPAAIKIKEEHPTTSSDPLVGSSAAFNAPAKQSTAQAVLQRRTMYAPIDIKDAEGVELLTPQEQTLCSNLRILPRPYLIIKETLLREYTRVGSLRKRDARKLIHMDVNKTGRVYDFFLEMGWVSK